MSQRDKALSKCFASKFNEMSKKIKPLSSVLKKTYNYFKGS